MRRTCAKLALLFLAVTALCIWAQNTSLVIEIKPEAHLSPSSIPLSFTVVNPGEVVVGQPVAVTAWVRALPGQKIQLTAQMSGLTGPGGSLPASALSWTSTAGRATGGGTTASCIGGNFSGGPVQPLISGWNQSGIASCNVSFVLSTDPAWPVGAYSGIASLTLIAQ